jgi:hypothetical protein
MNVCRGSYGVVGCTDLSVSGCENISARRVDDDTGGCIVVSGKTITSGKTELRFLADGGGLMLTCNYGTSFYPPKPKPKPNLKLDATATERGVTRDAGPVTLPDRWDACVGDAIDRCVGTTVFEDVCVTLVPTGLFEAHFSGAVYAANVGIGLTVSDAGRHFGLVRLCPDANRTFEYRCTFRVSVHDEQLLVRWSASASIAETETETDGCKTFMSSGTEAGLSSSSVRFFADACPTASFSRLTSYMRRIA